MHLQDPKSFSDLYILNMSHLQIELRESLQDDVSSLPYFADGKEDQWNARTTYPVVGVTYECRVS